MYTGSVGMMAVYRVLWVFRKGEEKGYLELIRELSGASSLPWCIIGDFNEIMSLEEKRGGQSHLSALIDGFSEVIMECGLVDLGFLGDIFTWERSRGTERWIQERLDRALATKEWMDMFNSAEEPECRNIIQECWNNEDTRDLLEKMDLLKSGLTGSQNIISGLKVISELKYGRTYS
ncbi:hypothetical protein AgCh_014603 [Apium graveolens]